MKSQTPPYFADLLADQTPPCISIYMPTLRAKPGGTENPQRLENLARKAEAQLHPRHGEHGAQSHTQRIRELIHDAGFWSHPLDGLAVFSSQETFHALKLERPVREMVEVAESFQLKPLIRAQQFSGRYDVLCLSQRHVRLYEGTQAELRAVELKNVPQGIAEAMSLGRSEPRRQQAGTRAVDREPRAESTSGAMDVDRFFRTVDHYILEFHSRRCGLPMVLCAVEEYHGRFHRLSHNPNLVAGGIKLNPDSIDVDRLREEAWRVIEPHYRQQIENVLEEFGKARAQQQGSEDLEQVAEAAAFSRVGTLLVDADKQIGGKLDPTSGRVEYGDLSRPEFGDLLDDIAERVIKTGGQVVVMPHHEMPTGTGVAAIYRF